MSARHEVFAVTRRAPGEVKNRVVRFVMSSDFEDRAGDTVSPGGWVLANYMLNPVVLWCHDQDELPIGKVVNLFLEGSKLVGDVEFATAEQNPFAEQVFQLVKAGIVNAGSVGFKPLRWEINDKGGLDFKEQELLEFSIVGVPCNPQALARVKSAGLEIEPRAFLEATTPADETRNALLAEAREKSARSVASFKRAHFVRERQFQLGAS